MHKINNIYFIHILSGVGLCLIGRHVHEGFSYNQFIGTDVAQVAVEMNQDLHMERADRIAVTTSVLCVVVEMGGSGGSSR